MYNRRLNLAKLVCQARKGGWGKYAGQIGGEGSLWPDFCVSYAIRKNHGQNTNGEL